nr:hypothetical protein [Phyllobacterium sp. SYP-B3895]
MTNWPSQQNTAFVFNWPQNVHAHLAGRDHDLHIDGLRIDTLEGDRPNTGDHDFVLENAGMKRAECNDATSAHFIPHHKNIK